MRRQVSFPGQKREQDSLEQMSGQVSLLRRVSEQGFLPRQIRGQGL